MCNMCNPLHILCMGTCAQGTTSCGQMKENRDEERGSRKQHRDAVQTRHLPKARACTKKGDAWCVPFALVSGRGLFSRFGLLHRALVDDFVGLVLHVPGVVLANRQRRVGPVVGELGVGNVVRRRTIHRRHNSL